MAMPPSDVAPKDLWAKLQERPRPFEVVDFPRKDAEGNALGQIAIWVLSQEETMSANAEAEKFARKLLKEGKAGDLGYDALFNGEGAVQTLWRACRKPEDLKQRAFPTPDALRSFSVDEINVLFSNYCTIQVKFGPIIADMRDGELDAWIDKLAKGQTFFFDHCSSDVRTALTLSMARRLASYSTDTFSAGSPPVVEPIVLSDEVAASIVREAREAMRQLAIAMTILSEAAPAFVQAADSLANFETRRSRSTSGQDVHAAHAAPGDEQSSEDDDGDQKPS